MFVEFVPPIPKPVVWNCKRGSYFTHGLVAFALARFGTSGSVLLFNGGLLEGIFFLSLPSRILPRLAH